MLSLTDLLHEYETARAHSVALIKGLDQTQASWRPHENSSAIGWHLGHQGAVTHYMLRNLTAAEATFDAGFDAVFDSATPEPERGSLPPITEILKYRRLIAQSTTLVIGRIDAGDVGAPDQLRLIAVGLMHAVVNHEYQHAKWIGEVRDTMLDTPAPIPTSSHLVQVEGYWMVDAA